MRAWEGKGRHGEGGRLGRGKGTVWAGTPRHTVQWGLGWELGWGYSRVQSCVRGRVRAFSSARGGNVSILPFPDKERGYGGNLPNGTLPGHGLHGMSCLVLPMYQIMFCRLPMQNSAWDAFIYNELG